MLKNPDITIKLITGTWGTGKTLALVVAALEAVQRGEFEKIIWVRNNIEVKDTVPLEEGRELFSRKKFGGSSKIYRRAKKHAMRRELLRLQPLTLLNPPPLQEEECK